MTKIYILEVRTSLIFESWEGVSYFYPTACITDSIKVHLICQYLSCFFINNLQKEEVSSKPDFYDARGDEKPSVFELSEVDTLRGSCVQLRTWEVC